MLTETPLSKRQLYGLGAGTSLLAAATLWAVWPTERQPQVGTVVVDGPAAFATPTSVRAENVGLALHAVFIGGRPESSSATIAVGTAAPRPFRIGEEVAPSVRIVAISVDHVTLDEFGRLSELYLLNAPSSDRAGRKGLDVEATRPSGELSAAEQESRMAAAMALEPVQKTPEEIAAGL